MASKRPREDEPLPPQGQDSKRQHVSKHPEGVDCGKGAVVTGAASGIGLATARLLAARGCRVLIADRDEENGQANADALGQLYKFVDVSDGDSIRALIAHAVEVLPAFSYLINCAGCDFYANFERASSTQFDRAFQVNLRSMHSMCREALGALKASRGSVVNVASIQGHRCFPDYSAYAATKGGIIAMSRQLAGDLAQFGVRVNSVSPGAVHTNLGRNSVKLEKQDGDPEKTMPCIGKDELLGMLPAEQVAEAIVSMASLRGVTGQDLVVDGGCSIIGVPHWRPFPKPEDYSHVPKD